MGIDLSKTTCPYDCYDACKIEYKDNKFRGIKTDKITNGHLCQAFNNAQKADTINSSYYQSRAITDSKALDILSKKLQEIDADKTLYFKGSGHFGVMQNITKKFFAKYGSVEANGTLCDGAGLEGIIANRGSSRVLPTSVINKSEVVVIWGRDTTTTNSHLSNIIQQKIKIVIDPYKTDIAKQSDLHLQIRPKTDALLALIIARFIVIEGSEDREFIKERCDGFDDFIELTQTLRIKTTLDKIGISLGDIGLFLELIKSKKVVFLIGLGVQKYIEGDEILRAIDSIGAILGLFGKDDAGVAYLAQSGYGIDNPFDINFSKTTPKPSIDFTKYDLVFIQGANPLHSNPDSIKIQHDIKKPFVVYYGLYHNKTSENADLIIPTSHFTQKKDVRFSYFHEDIGVINIVNDSKKGISEYDITIYLISQFGYQNLDLEDNYLKQIISSYKTPEIPYKDKFDTYNGKFEFIDDLDIDELDDDGYYLITKKPKNSINSTILSKAIAYINPSTTIKNGSEVTISSSVGSAVFRLEYDDNLREDCIMILSSAKGVNSLTPSQISYEGDSAIYQEIKLKIKIF